VKTVRLDFEDGIAWVFDSLEVDERCAVVVLSEINWGIIPAGVVCKALSTVMSERDALYYIMTGETSAESARPRCGW
jgi:enoyl-CoA hydratase/carnithine racemase